MKDFSPAKRKRFGGRGSDRSEGRIERRDSGRSEGRFRDRESDGFRPRFERREEIPRKYERHTVTCDSCGKRCEVPFKPTSSKPVYCSDCFKKPDRNEVAKFQNSSEEFERINMKLDKILKALNMD